MQELTPKQQCNRTNARKTIETGSYVQTKAFLRKGNCYCFNGALLDMLMSTKQAKSDWKPAFGCTPGNNIPYHPLHRIQPTGHPQDRIRHDRAGVQPSNPTQRQKGHVPTPDRQAV